MNSLSFKISLFEFNISEMPPSIAKVTFVMKYRDEGTQKMLIKDAGVHFSAYF